AAGAPPGGGEPGPRKPRGRHKVAMGRPALCRARTLHNPLRNALGNRRAGSVLNGRGWDERRRIRVLGSPRSFLQRAFVGAGLAVALAVVPLGPGMPARLKTPAQKAAASKAGSKKRAPSTEEGCQ